MTERTATFCNLVLLLYKRSVATLLEAAPAELLNGQLISQSHEGLQV